MTFSRHFAEGIIIYRLWTCSVIRPKLYESTFYQGLYRLQEGSLLKVIRTVLDHSFLWGKRGGGGAGGIWKASFRNRMTSISLSIFHMPPFTAVICFDDTPPLPPQNGIKPPSRCYLFNILYYFPTWRYIYCVHYEDRELFGWFKKNSNQKKENSNTFVLGPS